jgi:alpha-L-fucosidase
VDSIVDDLVDIVSKNGCLLLNIGPKPDGTIPEPEERILREIGAWLSVNGEAVYGTRPWTTFGEGPTTVVEGPFADTKRKPFTHEDVRCTTRGGTVYAIALAAPADGRLTIRSLSSSSPHLGRAVDSVSVLGTAGPIRWSQDDDALRVDVPAGAAGQPAVALRVTVQPGR